METMLTWELGAFALFFALDALLGGRAEIWEAIFTLLCVVALRFGQKWVGGNMVAAEILLGAAVILPFCFSWRGGITPLAAVAWAVACEGWSTGDLGLVGFVLKVPAFPPKLIGPVLLNQLGNPAVMLLTVIAMLGIILLAVEAGKNGFVAAAAGTVLFLLSGFLKAPQSLAVALGLLLAVIISLGVKFAKLDEERRADFDFTKWLSKSSPFDGAMIYLAVVSTAQVVFWLEIAKLFGPR